MKRQVFRCGVWLLVLGLSGCAATRYEEVGPPPTGEMAKQSMAETVPALEKELKDLQERVAKLEAEMSGRFSGLEAAQGDLATRVMSLSEQLDAVSRQLQASSQLKPQDVTGASSQPKAAAAAPLVQDLSHLYEQALSAYYDRQYDAAQKKFEQVLDLAPHGDWADNAQYWIGECEYGKKNYQAALDAFHKVFQYAKTEKADDAQFMTGQCYYNLGSLDNALVEFNRLKIDYPDSEYIGRADAYIRKIRAAQDASK